MEVSEFIVKFYDKKYEDKGFSTPTKKFELHSTLLEKWGYDPLPQFREPIESPVSAPEVYKQYPYILITGRRLPGFFHTENRQLPWMKELHREPVVEVHPDTAKKEGINEGDWIIIESQRGKVRQRAKFFEGMDPRIVSAEHAWWFPEKPAPEHGCFDSNINAVLTLDPPYDPVVGNVQCRAILCRVEKAEPQ